MARKRKASSYNEEFKSSFGVNASVPDAVGTGKTVSTPLDDNDPQEPMQKLDDKGNPLAPKSEEMHEVLATKDGMMSEIMKALRESRRDKVAETFSSDNEEVEESYLSENEYCEDDEDEDKDDDKKKDDSKVEESKEYLRSHILKSLYEDEEVEDTVLNDVEENYEYFEEEDENPFAKKDDDKEEDDEDKDDDDDEESKSKSKDDDEDDDGDEKVKVVVNEKDDDGEMKEWKSISKDDLILEYNIDGLFKEGKFSKQFVTKAKSMFEAAVLANVNANIESIKKIAEKNAEREAVKLRESLVNELDTYLSYVVENFLEENKLAVQNGLRMEVYENFMHELHQLFERHYIKVPEDKVDIVDIMAEKLDKTEKELNEEIQRNVKLSSKFNNLKKKLVFENVTQGLTQSHKARLANLSENIEYVNENDFSEKLSDMKKVFINESVETSKPKKQVRREDAFSNDYDGRMPRSNDGSLIEAVITKIDHLARK